MVFLVKKLAIIGLFAFGLALPAVAQNPYSAAYRVNESIISYFDIDQRVRLMRVLGANDPNLRDSAIEDLIDDRLKTETARNYGIDVSAAEIDDAIGNYAAQRNMTGDQIRSRVRGAGISQEAFEDFISVSLVWRTILRARFGQLARPSEIDLNAQLNTIAVSSSSAIQLGEISLRYSERGQEGTVSLATQLVAQLRAGGDFAQIAQEYSRAASAPDGGVIGWVSPTRLPPQIKAAIRGLGRGGVSDPIFIPSGVIIIKVLNTRTVTQQVEVPTSITVTYAQFILPHAAGDQAATMRQANRLRRSLNGCRGVAGTAAGYADGSGQIGPVALGDISADIGLALARLDPRDSVAMPETNAVRVLVLCDRVSEMTTESRATLQNRLYAQNLNTLSEGFLLELRRTSVIERR